MNTPETETIERTIEYGGYGIRVVSSQSPAEDDMKKWIITWDIFDPQRKNADFLIYRPIDADTEMVVNLEEGIAIRFAEARAFIDRGTLPLSSKVRT
jgi:hypothetical protein